MQNILKTKEDHLIFIALFLGIPLIIFGLIEPFNRLIIDVQGIVVKVNIECQKEYPNKCISYYTIRSSTGSLIEYAAYGNDHSLRRDLQIGAKIEKKPWKIDYKINGNYDRDFPLIIYLLIVIIGISIFLNGFKWVFIRNKNDV